MTQNVWAKVTNSTGNLRQTTESNMLYFSGDSMFIINSGDYMGSLNLSISSTDWDDVAVRLYDITNWHVSNFSTPGTAIWATNFVDLSLALYLESARPGDKYQIQIVNLSNNNDIHVRGANFYMTYLHE